MNTASQTLVGMANPCRHGRTLGLRTHHLLAAWLLAASAGLGLAGSAQAQTAQKATVIKGTTAATAPVPSGSSSGFAALGPTLELIIGKSTLMRTPSPIERISVGNPSIADVSLINPSELYLLGKAYGSTNLVIWRKGAETTVIDVNVSIDADRMEKKLRDLLPDEPGIRVRPAADSVILTGVVSSAAKAKYAEDIANAFVRDINKNLVLPVTAGDVKAKAGTALSISGGTGEAGAKVVNLLRIAQGQQVMLEVKIAEVSKSLIDKLGSSVAVRRTGNNGDNVFSMLSNFLSGGGGLLEAFNVGRTAISIDGQNDDGLVRVLAEPNIMAVSGQSASFLSGGKIFIPVSQTNGGTAGGSTITLEEKEFGIGVRFTPTVMDGTRINLKLVSEVSDLTQTGSPFTTINGNVSILPSLTVRRADTTVQLNDGQSFVIAGLIKNNSTAAIKRFPGLGEVPVIGALFRSSEFQKDQTELLFVITPRLVKPLAEVPVLPTSNHVEPKPSDVFLYGTVEAPASAPAANQ
jgi:pilus assembly protein CpaC